MATMAYIHSRRRTKDVERSIVGVPLVPTALAGVEDGAAFVGAAQLLCVVSHFFLSATLARVSDGRRGLHIFFSERLHFGSLGTER